MNTPSNAPQPSDDLVLRLLGGACNGQLFTVQNEKCLLSGLLSPAVDAEQYRCAIFRSEKGVAFHSYSQHVLCNGAKVSNQWLKQGDLIKLTDDVSVEVVQLGVFKKSAPTVGTPAPVRQEVQPFAAPPSPVPVAASATSKFEPATHNLRTPNVMAPLDNHQPQTSPLTAQPPVHNQAVDSGVAASLSPTDNGPYPIGLQSQSDSQNTPSDGAPKTPTPQGAMDSPIDSQTDRLSKSVDVASGDPATQNGIVGSQSAEHLTGQASGSQSHLTQSPELLQPPAAPAVPHEATSVPQVAVPNITAPIVANSETATATAGPTPAVGQTNNCRSTPENYVAECDVAAFGTAPQHKTGSPAANSVSPLPVHPTSVASVQPQPVEAIPTVTSAQDLDLDSVLAKLESSVAKPSPGVAPAAPSPTPNNGAAVSADPIDLDSLLQRTSAVESTPPMTANVAAVNVPAVEAVTPAPSAPVPGAADPSIATPHATAVVANEIPLTSSDTAGDDTNADPTTPGDTGDFKSFALLQSIGLDTSGLGEIKKELAAPRAAEELIPSNDPITLHAEPRPEPETEPANVESVADVLARMQSSGSFQDFKADDAAAMASETVQPVASTPPPVQQRAPVETNEPTFSDVDDGSVEDYMSQLLNRMRGDDEPTTGKIAAEKQDDAIQKGVAGKSVPYAASNAVEEETRNGTLTPEEFVPKQKAIRMQSLDSLREIANSSAREAFHNSVARERTVSTQTKLKIALISLAFAVLSFGMSYLMQERINFWGVVCGFGFLIFGIITARTYLNEQKLDESIISD